MRKIKVRNLWIQDGIDHSIDVTDVLKELYDGAVVGDVTRVATNYAADAALGDADFPTSFIELDGGGTCDITEFTPTKGKTYVIVCTDSTVDPTITTSAGVTFDGTNNTASFPDAGDALVLFAISATQLIVVENIGTVGLTSV